MSEDKTPEELVEEGLAELSADVDAGDVVDEEVAEYSDVERQAMEMGWNPEGVEGKRNLSAEEYVDRKELYDTIHSLKKQNKRLEEGVDALKKHQENLSQKAREQVLAELKEKKREALEEDNYDAVIEIDDQIAEVKAEATAEKDTPQPNAAFEDWVEKNQWYNQDVEMRQYADMIGPGLFQRTPGMTPEQLYDAVTAEVKQRFADKFNNSARSKPSPVEGASRSRSSGKAKYSVKDLPAEDREIMKTLVKSKILTEDEYLEQYFG